MVLRVNQGRTRLFSARKAALMNSVVSAGQARYRLQSGSVNKGFFATNRVVPRRLFLRPSVDEEIFV